LWVNLIMDTFASLALATDTPTDAMLKRKPYPRTKALISERMAKHIVGQAIFQLVVLLTLTFAGDKIFDVPSGFKDDRRKRGDTSGPSLHYTIVFNVFVFLQLFNEINARRIHDELNVFEGIFQNQLFLGISIAQVVMQVCIVQFGGLVFGCVALSWSQWLACLVIGALSLPVGLALRCLQANHLPSWCTICQDTTAVAPYKPSVRTQELWQRGFRRLRVQLRVIKAFKRSVSERKLLH
ncbi:hypothetical protein As57867_009159, partial [Aphanomyces stellatus]